MPSISQLQVDGSNLEGNEASITVHEVADGGIFYPAIPGQFLATSEQKPQVNKFKEKSLKRR